MCSSKSVTLTSVEHKRIFLKVRLTFIVWGKKIKLHRLFQNIIFCLKVLAHCFFRGWGCSYASCFPIKMLATYAKTQKIEPGLIFFNGRRKFWRQCVNMIDNMIVRLYLFFNVHKFQMGISESVCNDAYTKKSKSKAQNDIKVLITTEYIFFCKLCF